MQMLNLREKELSSNVNTSSSLHPYGFYFCANIGDYFKVVSQLLSCWRLEVNLGEYIYDMKI
jgi:hypothetical protein